MSDARAEIGYIRAEVEAAAQTMITAATCALDLVARARAGDGAALDGVEQRLCAILHACAFQDLTGQRLDRLDADGVELRLHLARDPMLNGPACPGRGLDQAAADGLFSEGPDGR